MLMVLNCDNGWAMEGRGEGGGTAGWNLGKLRKKGKGENRGESVKIQIKTEGRNR